MTKFNYFREGVAIPKELFELNVPKDWEQDLDKYGEYSSGYYRAVLRDDVSLKTLTELQKNQIGLLQKEIRKSNTKYYLHNRK
jgi:hypothetical protein